MRGLAITAAVLGLTACGDDGAAPVGPQPLTEDPAVQVGCLPQPAGGITRAKRVDCADELIGGRLASGRVGDFLLENRLVRVIVRGPGEGYYLHGSSGGGLVDAARWGAEDLMKEALPAVDLAAGAFGELVITEAGDDGAAELVVRGPATGIDVVVALLAREPPPVIIEHRYRLAADAVELELETRVFAMPGTEEVGHDLYDAMFMGGRAPAFLPGQGWADGPGSAEMIATGGTTTSYGLVYPAGARDPQLIDLGGIRLVLGASTGAEPTRRWLVIGDGSVSSVTDRGWILRGGPLGGADGTTASGVDVVVRANDKLVTIARADATGTYRLGLPPGAYTLAAEAPGRAPGAEVPITVTDGAQTTTAVPAGPSGSVALTVRDDSGAPIPARVLIEQAGVGERRAWVGATGDLTLALPPGTWRVSVSRGLEYDAFVATGVAVTDGQTTPLAVTLEHAVDTAGWISLDTHLHSELSTDSTFPIDDRVRAVAGEGVEVPISTDHDVIVDYAPVVTELGLDAWVGSLIGSETSSIIWGHTNAFPLVPDESRTGAGSPRWLARSPGQVFAALRGDGSRLVQINHPRDGSDSLFDAIDLDPLTLTARRDATELGLPAGTDLSDLSFDAIEVANASSDGDFEEVFADWLAMVTAGHPAAATGSSDSHGPSSYAGEARTFVWVGAGADDPATISADAIVDAIRARHVVVGTCAFVTAGIVTTAGTSLPGDTVDLAGATEATLRIRVQAPAWQPLAEIRIYQGRGLLRTIPLDPADTATVRFDADVVVPVPAADTFWVVRVEPAGRGDPVLGDSMAAFTNPLFADVVP